MFHRSHLGMTIILTGAAVAGAILGSRAAVRTALASVELPRPTTTDVRHPVEVYYVPAFIRDLPVLSQSLRLEIFDEDRLQMEPPLEYGMGGQLVLTRALPVTVVDAGTSATYRTWVETVGELLSEQRIELGMGNQDRVEPSLETALALDQSITITRVSVVEVTKTVTISFTTRTEDDPNRPRGERQLKQHGENGTKLLTYQVTRENGKEIGRKLIKTEVTNESIDEIVTVGTRVVVLSEGRATWYDPPWSGLTAAHNTLPKGTLVDVVSVKTGKRVTVRINDRGIQSDAMIDLSVEAFRELATLGTGVIQVRLEVAG